MSFSLGVAVVGFMYLSLTLEWWLYWSVFLVSGPLRCYELQLILATTFVLPFVGGKRTVCHIKVSATQFEQAQESS